jgi:hypothetical protein
MGKSRKFKKKLAPKRISKKSAPVLSVELIRKETLVKINRLWKHFFTKAKSFKLAK